jgi:uncharacterized membrane protein
MTAISSPVAKTGIVAKTRIASIDLLRGAVMIIMALDHVRDFFMAGNADPTDLHTTTPALFFTRWITHFCAPVFLFLSGISASLSGQRKTKAELSVFLIKRGIWLVLIELTVVTLAWRFDPFYHVLILQVIWAIGCSMIILGLLVRISRAAVVATGFVLFLGHNIMDYWHVSGTGWTLFVTSNGAFIPFSKDRGIFDLYPVVSWTGAMLLGYGAGAWYAPAFDAARRKRILAWTGLGVIVLFVVLRFLNAYGDPSPWSPQPKGLYTLFSFLNVTKYPCSLIYLCMTLGPALLLLSLTEQTKCGFSRIVSVYGRVPFFYYVLHLYLIHLLCVGLFFASGYGIKDIATGGTFLFRPRQMGFDLLGVYEVWIFVVFLLYFPCRWYDDYKKNHRKWWLSYL